MADLSDEILMAYADGALAGAERARVEQAIAREPVHRQRLAAFESTRDALPGAWRETLAEPVPAQLANLVRDFPLPKRSQTQPDQDLTPLQRLRQLLLPQGLGWSLAAACSVAFVAGAASTWYARAPRPLQIDTASLASQFLAARGDGHVRAAGPLQAVLEATPGDMRVPAIVDNKLLAHVSTRVTFRGTDGFCRQYALDVEGGSYFSGIACRQADGGWAIQAHLPTPRPSGSGRGFGAASARDAPLVGSLVELMKQGETIERSEEAAIISRAWKP